MRKPLIDTNGYVMDVVMAGDGWTPPAGLAIGPEGGEIGDRFDGSSYLKPPPLPPEVQTAEPPAPAAVTDPALLEAMAAELAAKDALMQQLAERLALLEAKADALDEGLQAG
jgi:hypothetical protein